ncbi:DUF397 domain-containing protein [Streptomyces cyaneochromogenes]|uniref:DUF397 domain-containing protein n=1 Tax=Streptomyces cyaneochromogenes TaxID=2496836 RepID=A0A3S9MCK5_9ACTN|nr:DUF397 domain-containing protein [Streptomyces cyaneochromogenes]AZQ36893.1 DUF397 domain-containing protein [Streptomyces cyaneochromogenes]
MKPKSNIDLSSVQWRKSSYSNGTGGECVEVAHNVPGTVPVRDSKNPKGPALVFPHQSWALFLDSLKAS